MKVLAVLFVAVLVVLSVNALSEEQKTKLRGLYTKCVDATKVDTELITKARKKNFTDDPKLKSYYHCMFKNLGWQKDDGTLDTDVIIAKIPVEKKDGIENIVKDCSAGLTGTPEEIAYKAITCFITKSPEEIAFN